MLRQNNMMGKTKKRSLIILNVDGLSLIMKNLKLRSYLKKQNPALMLIIRNISNKLAQEC